MLICVFLHKPLRFSPKFKYHLHTFIVGAYGLGIGRSLGLFYVPKCKGRNGMVALGPRGCLEHQEAIFCVL